MKNIKNLSLAILVLTGAYLVTACGSPVKELEPIVELTEEDFEVITLTPEVDGKLVTLKGSFSVDEGKVDQEIKWGFLWRASNESNDDMRTIYVGKGFSGRDFLILEEGLPVGTNIMVCAFIEVPLTAGAEATQIPGDEVFFDF